MKDEVLKLHDKGFTTSEIAVKLGVTRPTISYHKKQLGVANLMKIRKDVWTQVQEDLDKGVTYAEISHKYAISKSGISHAVTRGAIERTKRLQSELSVDDYCSSHMGNAARSSFRRNVRVKMIKAERWKEQCTECGLTEWMGKSIPLQVDHKDGNPKNNNINNLRLLCCNCHYQTDTWGNKIRNIAGSNN
jgi:orotate phosphoribosyltransferase-like protein